ncbi:extracellular serine-rich protein [Purpureocillium lavendulum]|uniref:Extracellular serine-rich protein n=1 Tax=Purpureocillium lavendulum TaxID=1247861 RepID=A0AB34G3S3_9HYPO|nr:extracellular serine-rich protein [Purpureocillium lavendulum]
MRVLSTLLAASALLADSLVDASNWDVTVGKGSKLKFDPETITARVGDTVTYHFFSKASSLIRTWFSNHAVTQSSFDKPCELLETGGFFSGFTPTASDSIEAPTTFTITVNDTKPVWVYCAQTNGNHCQSGMVHAINAPTTGNTIDAYRDKAKNAPTSTSPANGLPVGGTRVLHVDVGLNGLSFSPNNVTELVGTVVQFGFNPKNHSVVQSSFDKPCQPLAGSGFSSGFIPTSSPNSGVQFQITINDTKPIWYYCAQTNGAHCQSGMVGSINAATTGDKTFAAFVDLAAKAPPPSTIPPHAPLGGSLSVNGSVISSLNGNVLNVTAWSDYIMQVPKPGDNDQYMMGVAGGGAIANYNWGNGTISDDATRRLQLLHYLDNALLVYLTTGVGKLTNGDWSGVYPQTIVDTFQSMAGQAYFHRSTASDVLQHFHKSIPDVCQYQWPGSSIDDYVETILKVLMLETALLLDTVAAIASTDPWLAPCMASAIGAKSSMAGVIGLMQNHTASPAPREVALPPDLVYSYLRRNCIHSCPSDTLQGWSAPLAPLNIIGRVNDPATGRLKTIQISHVDSLKSDDQRYVAFLGPYGQVLYSPLNKDNTAEVPPNLYAYVWVVMTKAKDASLRDLYNDALAGPEMIWVSKP